jgi:hypothetical protein
MDLQQLVPWLALSGLSGEEIDLIIDAAVARREAA